MTYASYAKLRDARGLKDNDVAHLAGVPQSTFPHGKREIINLRKKSAARLRTVSRSPWTSSTA